MPKSSGQIFRTRGGNSCKCKDCGREFNSVKLLSLHKKTTHNNTSGFNCPCGEKFKSDRDFQSHLTKVHFVPKMHLTRETWSGECAGGKVFV